MRVAMTMLLLLVTSAAHAGIGEYFLNQSATPIAIPGGATNYYLDENVPATSSVKTIKIQVSSHGTALYPVFTSPAFAAATTLDAVIPEILHLSANQVMQGCADVTVTTSRVSTTGVRTVIGSATVSSVTIPQGSAGGSAGFATFTFAPAIGSPAIASGEALAVIIEIANHCSSNRGVTLVFDGTPAPSRAVGQRAVRFYGSSGSFGTVVNALELATGQTVGTTAVTGWGLGPGEASFFPAVTSDGTVLFAIQPQTKNPFARTQCTMAIGCFNPTSAVCVAGGSAPQFARITIPTALGATTVPSGGCVALQGQCDNAVCTAGRVGDQCPLHSDLQCNGAPGGEDIADLQLVDDGAGERVVFISSSASTPQGTIDAFPPFGTVQKNGSGIWALASTRTESDLQASNVPASLDACPNAGGPCAFGVYCGAGGTCVNGICDYGACPNGNPNGSECDAWETCIAGQCGPPNCGTFGEVARLPQSGELVIGQYSGGHIVVADPDGTPRATYAFAPFMTHPCNPNATINLSPRDVNADPTGTLGDERFVIVYDTSDPRGQPMQEFTYDATASPPTVRPISAPVFPASPANPSQTCPAGGDAQGESAQYDQHGNLWVARSLSILGGPVAVYLKNPSPQQRKLDGPCSFYSDPVLHIERGWGTPCDADFEAGLPVFAGAGVLPNWQVQWNYNVVEAQSVPAGRSTMLVVTQPGQVVPIQETIASSGQSVWTTRDAIDFGLGNLGPTPPFPVCSDSNSSSCFYQACPTGSICLGEGHALAKGVLDPARRDLWIPVTVTEAGGPAGCFFDCQYEVGKTRDAWLARVSVDRALGFGANVSAVTAPSTATAGNAVTVAITSDITGGVSAGLDGSVSKLAIYYASNATPYAQYAWTEACANGSCTYSATVPASATTGHQGQVLVWHALFKNSAGTKTLHTTGRIQL